MVTKVVDAGDSKHAQVYLPMSSCFATRGMPLPYLLLSHVSVDVQIAFALHVFEASY